MHHKRKYRDALPMDVIISELENGTGSQFDPGLVPLLLELLNNNEN
jgi:response regulator RpfG family c-di-GMP phosphodiesterase